MVPKRNAEAPVQAPVQAGLKAALRETIQAKRNQEGRPTSETRVKQPHPCLSVSMGLKVWLLAEKNKTGMAKSPAKTSKAVS